MIYFGPASAVSEGREIPYGVCWMRLPNGRFSLHIRFIRWMTITMKFDRRFPWVGILLAWCRTLDVPAIMWKTKVWHYFELGVR